VRFELFFSVCRARLSRSCGVVGYAGSADKTALSSESKMLASRFHLSAKQKGSRGLRARPTMNALFAIKFDGNVELTSHTNLRSIR
jgi:hypothetical protein